LINIEDRHDTYQGHNVKELTNDMQKYMSKTHSQ